MTDNKKSTLVTLSSANKDLINDIEDGFAKTFSSFKEALIDEAMLPEGCLLIFVGQDPKKNERLYFFQNVNIEDRLKQLGLLEAVKSLITSRQLGRFG